MGRKNIALSYECSPTELKCNCNTGINRTAPAYKDYVFCTKNYINTIEPCSKKITATSEEHCGTYRNRYCKDGGLVLGACWTYWVDEELPRTCDFWVHKEDCSCCTSSTTQPTPCNCPRFGDTVLEKALCRTYFYRIHKRALPCDVSLIFKFILV